MSSRASPWWLFVLAAAYFAYFGLLLHCESRRIESIGFRVQFAGGGMAIQAVGPGSAAAESGLLSGDRIVAANARPIRVRGDWHTVEVNLTAGTSLRLGVERGATSHTVLVIPRRGAISFWRTRAGAVLAIARLTQFLTLCIACLMVFRRPHDPLARLGALLLASGSVFSVVLPPGLAAEWRLLPAPLGAILWIPFASSIAVGAILFSFFAAFPRPLFRSRLLWIAAWTPVVLVVGQFVTAFATAVYRPEAIGDPLDATLVMMAFGLYAGAGLIVLTVNYSQLRDINDRRRVRAIVPGSIAALLSGIVIAITHLRRQPIDMTAPLFDSPLLAVCTLVMLALPISFAYAILSRRMFDFATLLRQGVRYALARRVVLSIPLLLAGILVADVTAHADRPLAELVASRLAMYLPLAALAAYAALHRERWLSAIDRRFFRQRYDAERIVSGIISDLRQSGTVEAVAASVVARLDIALHPGFAALMQHERGTRSFQTVASAPAGAAPPPLNAGWKVIALARVLGAPLQLAPEDHERLVRGLPSAEREFVSDTKIELLTLVPARDDADRELLIALGPKRSEEPYGTDDLDLINGVADALSLVAGRAPQPPTAAATLDECPTCGRCYDSGTLTCADDQRPLEPARLTRVLAQRYRLDRRVAEGGMSRLYQAVDLALGREVAVKVLRDEWVSTPDSQARFRREARSAAALTHPNIVTVFDFGTSGGTAFLVMELLLGRTLRDELRERRSLPLPEVLAIVKTVGSAVETAHSRGLIHRDLKPENIFLGQHGSEHRIKIVDFGLAKSIGGGDDGFVTGPFMVGTPQYMAPEQLRGEEAEPAWDTWALAVITYELLTGALPFAAAAAALSPVSTSQAPAMGAWRSAACPSLTGDLQMLQPFFERVLAIDPRSRPSTAAAFVSALESAAAGVPTG